MSNDLATDQLKQEIDSGYVELYELEIGVDSGDGNTLYFHPGVQENLTDITYDGNTYIALPIMMDGIEMNSDGAIPRPTLTIANVESILKNGSKFKTQMDDGTWGSTVEGAPFVSSDFRIDDLVGATLTRRKTLEKYLSSSPVIEFDKDEYIIDRIQSRDNIFVTLELASPLDLGGMRIPNRVVIGKYCPWVYRGASNEVVESKRSGACTWKTENQLAKADNARASVFLNDKDEYIFLKSAIDSPISPAATFTTKSSSHSLNDFVVSSGLYYQSRSDNNTASLDNPIFWQRVRVYTVWSADSASTSYTTNVNVEESSYVYHAGTVWRVSKPHTKNASYAPELNSYYWVRGDSCGKLLNSCKKRYQAQALNDSTGQNFIASDKPNTTIVLPFGGFPGSRKFR